MSGNKVLNFLGEVVAQMPSDWLNLTTHRLDIYDESQAKFQFLDQFERMFTNDSANVESLKELPTAYDYIRLGHPLSTVLEWGIAKLNDVEAKSVIAFSSVSTPIMAILRKNLLEEKNTRIAYTKELPTSFDVEAIKTIYGYKFELVKVENAGELSSYNGSTIFVTTDSDPSNFSFANNNNIDFVVQLHEKLGSIILTSDSEYVSEIQHVRRRETIAMTPANCLIVLNEMIGQKSEPKSIDREGTKASVRNIIQGITASNTTPQIGSSGLSIQYAIMMGLIDDAMHNHPNKNINFIVPPNCYGGTNDQARRVAACLDNVEILDLPVDGDHDMVSSVDKVLNEVAKNNAVPYIIAEIPTNPRVEVPDMVELKNALSKERKTSNGETAVDPVFILDQTFCPNIQFLKEGAMLSSVRTISYVSGSKFPSGGKCTAGYCVANDKAAALIAPIEKHLMICDNEATDLQLEILDKQMPSMIERIADAYKNTRDYVNFIHEKLPTAKINFVSEELANEGFTPSVFSLDLPTKGSNDEEREAYKRELNLKLINMMIGQIPNESKYCVSYGQLKGCYWTIPATSTQGTTKEGDKDYIARVALSPDLDLDMHKKVFEQFVNEI